MLGGAGNSSSDIPRSVIADCVNMLRPRSNISLDSFSDINSNISGDKVDDTNAGYFGKKPTEYKNSYPPLAIPTFFSNAALAHRIERNFGSSGRESKLSMSFSSTSRQSFVVASKFDRRTSSQASSGDIFLGLSSTMSIGSGIVRVSVVGIA